MSKNFHWRGPKKGRKPRSLKADGEHMGQDLCRHCLSYGCDPFAMSREFYAKIHKRSEAGLCRSCGKNPCQCKSSMDMPKRTLSAASQQKINEKKIRDLDEKIIALEEKKKSSKTTAEMASNIDTMIAGIHKRQEELRS